MKHKISISIDFDTYELVRGMVREKRFQNKSQAFEEAIKRLR